MKRLARALGLFLLGRRAKLALYRAIPILRDDREDLAFYGQFVRGGDLVFDIGANVGIKTKTFRGLGARVVAAEPQPAPLAELRAVFGRDRGVIIVPMAVGPQPGRAELIVNKDHSGLSTLSQRWRTEGRFAGDSGWQAPVEVPVTTLDDLIRQHGVPSMCKIDVEGYEDEVVAGLSHAVPSISFEFHAELADVARRCIDHVGGLGAYEFNAVLGDERQMLLDTWVSGAEMKVRLEALSDGAEGEIYAKQIDR